jgi:aspartate aminotransferase-like enzyme
MTNEQILLTPGPTPIPPESLAEEAKPIIHHRTKEFSDLFNEFQSNLKYVFQTKEDVYIFASSGTGCMEAAVANLVSPGDKAIVSAGGVFGERWIKILTAFGANVVALRPSQWGVVMKPADIEKALAENPDAKFVFSTHTDTSTATAQDIQGYGKVVAKTKAVLVVDSISGLGGQELQMDAWGCDVVVSASQKGLMAAPGLGFVAVSQKAWPLVESSKSPRFYWDFRTSKKSIPNGETPYTPAISLIRATNVNLKALRKKTMPVVWQEARDLAKYTRELGKGMGLTMFAQDPCEVLTAFNLPAGVDGEKLIRGIVEKYNISLAGGQEKLKGKIVRVAHMGFILKKDIDKGMQALAEFLKEAAVAR